MTQALLIHRAGSGGADICSGVTGMPPTVRRQDRTGVQADVAGKRAADLVGKRVETGRWPAAFSPAQPGPEVVNARASSLIHPADAS